MTIIFNKNQNNNENNKFINFPHIILSQIIDILPSNIDRISFSLICKKFYNERDKYLLLDCDTIFTKLHRLDTNSFDNIHAKSYKNQFKRSLEIISNSKIHQENVLLITNHNGSYQRRFNDTVFQYNYDLATQKNNLDTMVIPDYITHIVFNCNDDVDLDDDFRAKLESSNVIYMESEYNNLVCTFGRLPENIRDFCGINLELLPFGLKRLTIDICEHDDFNGLLPSSLEYLKFYNSGFRKSIHLDSFPPNLKELRGYFNEEVIQSQTNYTSPPLPVSLHTIDLSYSWLEKIRHHQVLERSNVKIVQLYMEDSTIDQLKPGDIPQTITDLTIDLSSNHFPYFTKELLPNTLKRLRITKMKKMGFECNLFQDFMQLETLDLFNCELRNDNELGILPSNLKVFKAPLFPYDYHYQPVVLPDSLESLSIRVGNLINVKANDKSQKLKEVSLYYLRIFDPNQRQQQQQQLPISFSMLPSQSIETIDFNNYIDMIASPRLSWPHSVKTIYVSLEFFKENPLSELSTSISTIVVLVFYQERFHLRRLDNDYFMLFCSEMDGLIQIGIIDKYFNFKDKKLL